MCGAAFWKRVVVFCLTFGLSVLVSGLFVSKKNPAENIAISPNVEKQLPPENLKSKDNSIPKATNCVPADGKLEYIPLTANEDQSGVKNSLEVDKTKKTKGKDQNPKTLEKEIKRLEKSLKEFEVERKLQPQNLLHREKCFAIEEQK